MRLIPALTMLLFVLPAAATATDLIGTIVPPYPPDGPMYRGRQR